MPSQFGYNSERNSRLYDLWERGYTVRAAAAATAYPEGTTAYYWRKFNRAARLGKPILIGSTSDLRVPTGEVKAATQNMLLSMKIKKLVDHAQYQEAKDILEIAERSRALGLPYALDNATSLLKEVEKKEKRTARLEEILNNVTNTSRLATCIQCQVHDAAELINPELMDERQMLQSLLSDKVTILPDDATRREIQSYPDKFAALLVKFVCAKCKYQWQEISIFRL